MKKYGWLIMYGLKYIYSFNQNLLYIQLWVIKEKIYKNCG